MTKVIVVGGGASGLTAAITLAKRGLEVIILERNESLAKKILMTGNGRCNYWNENQEILHYHSSNKEFLHEIITKKNREKVLKFFEHLGVIPKVKNGYYYPYSNQAVSIKAALLNEIESLNIKVINNVFVETIKKKENQFVVKTNKESYMSDVVILATGSKAAPKTGSDGNGYTLAKHFGHTIIPVLPALTQVYGESSYYKDWNGIRTDVKISLYENGKLIKEEVGEIHLTDYGISGICTFDLSGYVSKGLSQNKEEMITINFLPDLNIKDTNEFVEWLDKRNHLLKNRTIAQLFDGFIHYKLVYLFLKLSHISADSYWNDLSDEKKNELVSYFLEYKLKAVKTSDFDKCQVCSGGVSLEEIDTSTMESKKIKNLYFTGEILDVDGDCGGYNLSFAWISGILAGSAVGDKND